MNVPIYRSPRNTSYQNIYIVIRQRYNSVYTNTAQILREAQRTRPEINHHVMSHHHLRCPHAGLTRPYSLHAQPGHYITSNPNHLFRPNAITNLAPRRHSPARLLRHYCYWRILLALRLRVYGVDEEGQRGNGEESGGNAHAGIADGGWKETGEGDDD
jgi:hypothetical protein